MASRITQDAIQKARAEFTQRLSTTGCVGSRVVVAQDVTYDDLDQVPGKWLEGTVVSLKDGTLSIHRLIPHEKTAAAREAALVLCQYAKTHRSLRVRAHQNFEFDLLELGRRTADVALTQYAASPSSIDAPPPLVVVEVIVGTPSCVDMVNAARGYLAVETVERVVLLQIFPTESTSHELWQVPALAVVFGYEDPADRSSRIRMLEVKSFGNAEVPEDVVDSLVDGVNDRESKAEWPELELLDVERGEELLEPGIPTEIDTESVLEDVEEMRTQAASLELRVSMKEPLGDIVFDLVPIFAAAVTGRFWDQDLEKHRDDAPDADVEILYSMTRGPVSFVEAAGGAEDAE